MKTYFITGISGFLGRNITIKLLEKDDVEIVGFVLPGEKNLDFYKQFNNIKLVEGNILNAEDVERFLSQPCKGDKIVIHAAGMISTFKKRDPLTLPINYDGTRNVVDAAIKYGCDKFVYISSVDSLNKTKGDSPIYEQDFYEWEKVDGVYSRSKALANNYVLDACLGKKIDGVIVLPAAIIGPNDPFNSPINYAIKRFLNGKLKVLVKGQYNIADVRDVADGILSACEKGRSGQSYILSGTHITMLNLINKVADIENKKHIKTLIPIFLVKLASPFIELHARIHKKRPLFTGFSMDCLQQNSHYSCEKAKKELGYSPIDIDKTLMDLVTYMKESHYLER